MTRNTMRRREFIGLLGASAVLGAPLAARAQQPVLPAVGFLSTGTPEPSRVAAFVKGLGEMGYAEGRNLAIEYRFAQTDRLSEFVADLIRRRVSVIAAVGSAATALAAKAATATIPIVFTSGTDPVNIDLVASLNRPGGNLTGISQMSTELGAKRLGLLHELLANAARIGLLVDPNNPNAEIVTQDAQAAAAVIGRQIEVLTAGASREIDAAFASLVQKRVDALLVSPSIFFTTRRVQLQSLATRHAIPAIYANREFVEAGGLMSYGPNLDDIYRQVGVYVGRILKGEKPADLPVIQPTKFEFVINLQTARTLGLTVPPTLLALADEVIE